MANTGLARYHLRWRPSADAGQWTTLSIPAFSFTDVEWLGASYHLIEYQFTLTDPWTLAYPIIPPDGINYILCVRTSDHVRYKLYDHADGRCTYPLYNGELLTEEFAIEVWTTNNTTIENADESLVLVTNVLDITIQNLAWTSTPADAEVPTTVDTVFALTGSGSVVSEETLALTFDSPYADSI